MDEHIISVNQQKESIVQFQVSIEGTDANDAIVRLVMDLNNGTLLMFPCVNIEGSDYEARLPALSHVERTAYPCYIEVITNGYYFKAMKGVINVVGSTTITAQPTTTFVKKSTGSKEETKEETEESSEESKKESMDVFKTNPTLPALGVPGVKELAERAVKEALTAAKNKKPASPTAKNSIQEEAVTEEVEETHLGTEPHSARDINDDKVKQVLESLGITVKPKRQIPKLKIKRKN